MKIRIDENGFFLGIYTAEFLANNANNVVNGALVSDWLTTDIEYNGTFLKPKLVDGIWIDGISIDEKNERKSFEITILNEETRFLLSATDEYVTREQDRSSNYKAMPDAIFNERLNIRQKQYEKEQEIIKKYS